MDFTLKKVFRVVFPILIYLAIERIVSFCANFLYICVNFDKDMVWTQEVKNQVNLSLYDMQNKNIILLTGIIAVIGIVIFYNMLKKEWNKRPYCLELFPSYKKPYVYVTFIAIGFTISVNLLINAWGLFKYDWDFAQVSRMIYYEPIYMQILVIGILVPICEELLFRGLIYERILQSGSMKSAMFLTSLLFAFFHGSWIQIIYAFVFSYLMLYVYFKCGSFRAPVIFHIISNLSSLILRQFPPLSTMGYSVGIVVFILLGLIGISLLKRSKCYQKAYK